MRSAAWIEAMRVARRPEHRLAGVLVLASGAALGLGVLLAMARTVSFPPVEHPVAVGWSTVHGYPEYQEHLYFILAVVGVPILAGLAWVTWALALSRGVRWAGALSRWTGAPSARSPADRHATAGGSRPPSDAAIRRNGSALTAALTWVVAPVLVYAILFEPRVAGPLDPFHEGEMLVPVLELRHGGIPYRDVYLQHGLLHNALIPWLGAKLFEPTVEGVRRIERVVEPLGAVALYFFAATIFRGRGITALVLAFFMFGAILGVPARAAFGFLALAVVAASVPRCRPRSLAAAGLLTAAAFWHSVEIGIYSAVAIGAFLLIGGCQPRRSALGWFTAGLFAGLAVPGTVFLWHGALDDLVRNVVIQTSYQSQAWGLPFPNLFTTLDRFRELRWPGSFASNGMLFYLPAVFLLITNLWLLGRLVRGGLFDSPADLRLLLLAVAGVCFFRSVLGRSDAAHLHYGVVFMTLLAMYVPDRLLTGPRSWPRVLTGLAAAAIVGSYAWGVYRPWQGLVRRLEPAPVATAEPAEPFAPVVEALRARTRQGERVFDFTNQGALLFLADRPSATRYFHALYAVTESLQHDVVETLERLRPVAILESGSVTESFDRVPQSLRTPLIADFLRAHYVREPVAGTSYVLGIPKDAVRRAGLADTLPARSRR